MKLEDLIRMGREAGMAISENQHGNTQFRCFSTEIERFSALVAAHERKECEIVCCRKAAFVGDPIDKERIFQCAEAIRARANHER